VEKDFITAVSNL